MPFRKTVFAFLGLTIFLVVFDRVYALFSHGVSSNSMDFAFVVPAVATLFYFVLGLFFPKIRKNNSYRMAYHLFNMGIVTLVCYLILKGIFEIAGTSSNLTLLFSCFAYISIGVGFIFSVYCGIESIYEESS